MKRIDIEKDEYYSEAFSCLNFSGKIVDSTTFDNCTFRECDFTEAVFNKSKFIECTFVRCNLSVVKVGLSRFLDVVFDECKVIGVDWTGALWPSIKLCSPIKFYKCIINDSIFFGLNLGELVIEECKAHDVDFREGDFSESNFSHTDFHGSMFSETNLSGVSFIEAENYNIDINFNDVKRAKFSRYEAIRLLDSLDIELVD
jgi:uncharacterized protein YjbI with pentapeptide repeats